MTLQALPPYTLLYAWGWGGGGEGGIDNMILTNLDNISQREAKGLS